MSEQPASSPYDPPKDLKKSSVRSGSIHLASRMVVITISLVSMMVLARLLRPSDFGIYAMAMTLMMFVRPFKDLGLSRALVNKDRLYDNEIDVLFRVTMLLHLVLAVVIALTAPLLAWFYKTTELMVVIPVLVIGFLISAFALQPEAILVRRMRFGVINAVHISSTVFSIAAAIIASYCGLAYWALVIQYIVLWCCRSGGVWLVCGWRPTWAGAWAWTEEVRGLMRYGLQLTGARILTQFGNMIDRVVVGYASGAAVLGIYDKARKWAVGPAKHINMPLLAVGVSGLSRLQHEPKKYRAFLRTSTMCVYGVILPILAYLWLEAEDVILLMLGNQWGEMAPYMRLFCVGSFAGMIARTTRWVYLSDGRTKRQLQWTLIATPINVLAVLMGAPWGGAGIAMAVSLSTILLSYPAVVFCFAGSIAQRSDALRAYWRPAVTSILAGIGLVLLGPYGPAFQLVAMKVLASLSLYALLYCIIWVVLPGGWKDLKMIVRVVASAWLKKKGKLEQVLPAENVDDVTPIDDSEV